MSDRSWTVTPALAWFGGFLLVAIYGLDGNLDALANRLTAQRAPAATTPAIAAPVQVADTADDTPAVPPPAPSTSRDSGGPLEDTCLDGTPDACKRWAMDAFYQAVKFEKHGTLGHPVRVSWYGDSVVATDMIPGHLRVRMQEALGDGGPGFVYAVAPHRFCGHEALARTAGGNWLVHAISTIQVADGLYGPAGSTAETVDGGRATIKLNSGKVTNVELYYLAQPHGGTATITGDGGKVLEASTAADKKQPGYAAARIEGAQKIELDTRGRVRVFGVDLENGSGAVVDNLGIVSVNVKSFGANDAAHWSEELAHRSSDLVMIMIGANEAEWLSPGDKDTKDYQSHYEQVLAPIRKGVPNASCLVVSPTDQAEVVEGAYKSRPVMPLLVDAQRKAAHAQGCAFYSTYDWMGGKGSAAKWFKKGLVSSDFQHLSKKGANLMADAVFDALMAGYKRYAHD